MPFPDFLPANELAGLLDITPRRLAMLAAEGHVPAAKRGIYQVRPTIHGYLRYLHELAEVKDGSGTLTSQRARLTQAKADIAEMQRRRLLSEMLPADQVATAWAAIVNRVRARLLAIPSKFAPRVVITRKPADAQVVLQNAIDEALGELAETPIYIVDDRGQRGRRNGANDHADVRAAAEADDL